MRDLIISSLLLINLNESMESNITNNNNNNEQIPNSKCDKYNYEYVLTKLKKRRNELWIIPNIKNWSKREINFQKSKKVDIWKKYSDFL